MPLHDTIDASNAILHAPSWKRLSGTFQTRSVVAGVLICVHLWLANSLAAQSPSTEIPRAELAVLYQTELKDRYDESKLDQLLVTHRLLEQFFAERSSGKRMEILQQLEQGPVDPITLGRMCRIRLHWPDLPGGVYYVSERVGPHTVAYFLGLPEGYTRAKAWPLVVRLPPTDAFARQPAPDQQEVARIYTGWLNEEIKQHTDAVVLMPLMNFDHLFGPSYAGVNAVMQPVFHAAERANIDPARVHLIGHSAGGHAAWNLALHYPTYFASFNALAGSAKNEFQRVRLKILRNTWPIVWHDADDELIKVDMSRQIVRALRAQKVDVDYEETKGLGHRPPMQLVDKMYAKLRKRVRSLYPAEVTIQSNRLDPIYNRADWLQIDQPTRAGDDQPVFFTRGTEKIVLQTGVWSATAVIKPRNQIEVRTDNVELLRLFLNEQMLDFDRAMSVRVNGRVCFEGFARPNVATLLNDQLFMGRGWRSFPAVIELDLAPRAATRPSEEPK
ncbi:MAG TPA: alpha/beta hydrolase-fold protein [Tepidisphaeraceae bacterium]|nr:alpha/beta hydrolase-fold protein [Tepidisphaeraceae bacterium]